MGDVRIVYMAETVCLLVVFCLFFYIAARLDPISQLRLCIIAAPIIATVRLWLMDDKI